MLVLKERSSKVISKVKVSDRITEWQTGPTVFLSETLTLLITFEDLSLSTNIFDPVTLEFCLLFENFNLGYTFGTVNARAFDILHEDFLWQDQDICRSVLGHIWSWPLSGAFVLHKHTLLSFLCYLYFFKSLWHKKNHLIGDLYCFNQWNLVCQNAF